MNKAQAYEAMRDGYKVRNEYYSPEEFAFINTKGLIELEDGVSFPVTDEAWTKYQDPEETFEWEIVGEADKFLHANKDYSSTDLPTCLINPSYDIYKPYIGMSVTKKQRAQIVRPVEPSSDINRNDPCMCGSGKKYKKCCGS